MSKSDLFKRLVLEQLYGKPESDSDHESEKESSDKPEQVENSAPPVRGHKVYGAALPPSWPQVSSGQDAEETQQSHTLSHSGSSTSSDSEGDEEYHKRRRKRRRRHAGTSQTPQQHPSGTKHYSGDGHTQDTNSSGHTQLSKNKRRKQKKKRQQKRKREEERMLRQTDSNPQQTIQQGGFVYEGSADIDLEGEENRRKEDLLKRLKDVTSFLDAVVDVYNRDMSLQDRVVEAWGGSESQALQTAVLGCVDSLQEVELLSRAKRTALLGHPGLAAEARLQLCQKSTLPADLVKFVSTTLEYWVTDVMKKT